jgi:phosphoglycerate dehydrogenase-like enzyme
MSKVIGVVADFLTEKHRAQIDGAAAQHGYATRYFSSSAAAVGNVGDCEILYGQFGKKALASAGSLKWFACCYAGVDQFSDDSLYRNPDCILTNSSGAYGTTISEHLLMVILMLLRRQQEVTDMIQSGGWGHLPGHIRAIHGSTVTVLGTGDIGTEFARRAQALKPAKIYGVRRSMKPCDPAFDEVCTMDELDGILPETEIIVMCLPSTPETVGTLSRERMALLPEGAYVVNVGRGTAIDQTALIDALNSGHLAGAALDVVVPEPLPADHPLRKAKNILLTPHVAGNMTLGYTCDLNVDMFCENIALFAEGKPMKHVVDRKKGY